MKKKNPMPKKESRMKNEKHYDEKEDKALVKKMVKKKCMK